MAINGRKSSPSGSPTDCGDSKRAHPGANTRHPPDARACLERDELCADLAVGNGSVTETSDAVSVEADNGFSKSLFAATASLSTAAQSAAYSSP